MKIIVAGDIHADWEMLNKLLREENPDILLQVGDFGYWPRFKQHSLDRIENPNNTQIYFCPGNHEDWDALDSFHEEEIAPNIHYMRKGTRLELPDGRNIMFIGGAYSVDKAWRTPGLTWFPQEIIVDNDLKGIDERNIDIVISHTCPEEFIMKGLPFFDKIHDPSRRHLSLVLENARPKEWYFGHWHEPQRGTYKGTKWTALNECRGASWWVQI